MTTMSAYDDRVLAAVATLAEYARSLSIEPDAGKVSMIVARAMFPDLDSELLRRRAAEIMEVATLYIAALNVIESAAVQI
jgi:hypothetical protein